jgi:type II secretory pathway pseudopilin PulG
MPYGNYRLSSIRYSAERGATLLELLIAIVMVIVVVVTLALFFPKANKAVTNNRRLFLANNFAASQIQDLKTRPYSYLSTTDAITANFPAGIATVGGCDCKQADYTALTDYAVYTEDGLTYTMKVCVNLVDRVGGAWQTYCPDGTSATDHGLKNIRARVFWSFGGTNYSTDTETLVTR